MFSTPNKLIIICQFNKKKFMINKMNNFFSCMRFFRVEPIIFKKFYCELFEFLISAKQIGKYLNFCACN